MENTEKLSLYIIVFAIVLMGIAAHVVGPDGTAVIEEMPNIFYASLAGTVIGVLGYTKKTQLPEWETPKLIVTIVISAVAGYLAFLQGMTFADANVWLATIGVDVVVERVIKTLIRRLQEQPEPVAEKPG